MKFIATRILAVVLIFASCANAETIVMKGAIVAPDRDKMEKCEASFAGDSADSNSEGFYSFRLDEQPADELFLLVSQSFSIEPDTVGIDNTATAIKQDSQKPYLFYRLQMNKKDGSEITWEIEEKSLKRAGYRIPHENAKKLLTVKMNPNHVSAIQNWKIKLDKSFITLPKVVLRSNKEILEYKNEKYNGGGEKKDYVKHGAEKNKLKSFADNVFQAKRSITNHSAKNSCDCLVETSIDS
ncbi:hypothetical protein HOD08_04525 [bacterium]|nr:hypothetical protein [bacterium]